MTTTSSRRFGAINRLYGSQAEARLAQAHIMVAGIGGVGSWCVEALARSGVGRLTLIDMDHLAESNINRQLPALSSTLGQAKVQAMADRLLDINPSIQVNLIDDFIGPENARALLHAQPDVLVDATDHMSAKVAMILEARSARIPLIVCGAAGGKTNALALRQGDLAHSTHDALLARLRHQLRRQHGFVKPKADKKSRVPKMGVSCLWVEQAATQPATSTSCAPATAPQGLSCAGYGSLVTVTAPMGMLAAQWAIDTVLKG